MDKPTCCECGREMDDDGEMICDDCIAEQEAENEE